MWNYLPLIIGTQFINVNDLTYNVNVYLHPSNNIVKKYSFKLFFI